MRYVSGEIESDIWLFDPCRYKSNNCLAKLKDLCRGHEDVCTSESKFVLDGIEDEVFCDIFFLYKPEQCD